MVHYTSIQELLQRHLSWVWATSGCKVLILPPRLLQGLGTTTNTFSQYSSIHNRPITLPALSWKLQDLALRFLTLTKISNARTTDNTTELTQAKVNLISHIRKPLCSPSVNTIGLIQHSYDLLTKLIHAINHPQMQCRGWIRETWCAQFLINSSSIHNQPFRTKYRELRNVKLLSAPQLRCARSLLVNCI